jgi:hypothetical protein
LRLYGILFRMCHLMSSIFPDLYSSFHAPITSIDCGSKCAPYNENGIPFCCDIDHIVPTAYLAEWEYLQTSTDLWRLWHSGDTTITSELFAGTPEGQELVACKGYQYCQRECRTLSCRSFPFFPYINSQGEFLGLSFYWEYRDRCWVISNLHIVSQIFIDQFVQTYERLFKIFPEDKENFSGFSSGMRNLFARSKRSIPLLHGNGFGYKISPWSERMRRFPKQEFPKFSIYKIAGTLLFPDETD